MQPNGEFLWVSPLAELRSADNSLLFQVAPTASSKYDKLKDDLSDARHVIVISSARNDAEFVSEITPFIPKSAKRIDYVRNMSTMTLADQLSFEKDNVIVVLSEDETTSESILAYIGSICSGMAAKEGKEPVVRVISSSRWSRFRNTDKDLFFKMNLRYVTSYHADRNNERVLNFDNRYISAFGSLPSLYSYRGYDVAKLFVGKLKLHGAEFISYLNDADLPLLQTPYRFEQAAARTPLRESGVGFGLLQRKLYDRSEVENAPIDFPDKTVGSGQFDDMGSLRSSGGRIM